VSARVVYVITDSGIGGSEKALLSVLEGIDRKRFDPAAVVVLKGRREMAERWEAAGAQVVSLGMGRWPSPLGFVRFLAILRSLRPTLVHAFLFHAIQFSRLASAGASWRLVTSPRVNYRFAPTPALAIDRILRRFDDGVLCESEAGKSSLLRAGYQGDLIHVAPNGVDERRFAYNEEARRRLRQEWQVREGEFVIGAVGRLHRQKGFDVLIEAMGRLALSPAAVRLVIAGSGPDEKALRQQASRHSVSAHFLGERRDVPELLSAFDIYVQSSRWEGLSNALLEAMSVGLPVAATAIDGTLDFARDGENMLLVRPEESLSLAVAMGLLVEKEELRRRLSENAKLTARQYSTERMVSAFHGAYDSVLSRGQ